MYNPNSSFSIYTLSRIVKEPIIYFIACQKKRDNLNSNTSTSQTPTPNTTITDNGTNTPTPDSSTTTTDGNTIKKTPAYLSVIGIDPYKKKKKTSDYCDEILFVCNSSIKFIGQNIEKGVKRTILFDNIELIECSIDKKNKSTNKRIQVIIELKEGIKKHNKKEFTFSMKNCTKLIEVLKAMYKIYCIRLFFEPKNLNIKMDIAENEKKDNNDEFFDIPLYEKHRLVRYNGYEYALSNIFLQEEDDPNVMYYESGEIRKNSFEIFPIPPLYIKVKVLDEKPIEYIIQNTDFENIKLISLSYLKNLLRDLCHGYQYFISPPTKINKKIQNDPSIWDCYLYTVKTNTMNGKGYNIIFCYIRRLYIPPLFESYNDIIFSIKEEYYENQPDSSLSDLPKVTTKIFLETLHSEEIKEENSVTKSIVNMKLNAFLFGKNNTQFLVDYNKKQIISNDCYKLFLKCQTKIVIIIHSYLKDTNQYYSSFVEKVRDAYKQMDGKILDVQEYCHNIKYTDFDKIIEKHLKEFKNIFNIFDPQVELLYQNKVAKYIGDTLLISSHTKNFLDDFDKCCLMEDLLSLITPIVNYLINFMVIFNNNDISLNETINTILMKRNIIYQISFNENILCKLIESGQLKKYQNIDNDTVYYNFLDFILRKKFSIKILQSIYNYLNKIIKSAGRYIDEEERYNDDIKILRKNSNCLMPILMHLYSDYSQNPQTIILACQCLIILITVSPDNKTELFSIEFSQYLYSYFSTPYEELIFYSIKLFRILTNSKSDLRKILDEKPGFLFKLVNIVKGTGIEGCYYSPKLTYLVLDFLSEIIKNSQIKSILFNQKNRKIIKYFIPYIENFEDAFGDKKYMCYYLPILTKVYNFLECLVSKDSEMRRYIENTFHLIKIINERCLDYITIANFEYKKDNINENNNQEENDEMIKNIERGRTRALFLRSVISFLNSYVSYDITLLKTIKYKGINIILLVIVLKDKEEEKKKKIKEKIAEKKIDENEEEEIKLKDEIKEEIEEKAKNENDEDKKVEDNRFDYNILGGENDKINEKYRQILDTLLDKVTI